MPVHLVHSNSIELRFPSSATVQREIFICHFHVTDELVYFSSNLRAVIVVNRVES